MKVIVLTIISIALASSLFASDAKKKEILANDMRSMLSALEDIQKAGFYNDASGMKDGINKLTSGLSSLETTDAKSYLPDEEAYADKFAQKRARMIKMYADDILESVKANNMEDALEDYTQILRQCSSCHMRIRKW